MTDITKKNLAQIVKAIKGKEISSTEVTAAFIKNIEKSKTRFFVAWYTNCCERFILYQRYKNNRWKQNVGKLYSYL